MQAYLVTGIVIELNTEFTISIISAAKAYIYFVFTLSSGIHVMVNSHCHQNNKSHKRCFNLSVVLHVQ